MLDVSRSEFGDDAQPTLMERDRQRHDGGRVILSALVAGADLSLAAGWVGGSVSTLVMCAVHAVSCAALVTVYGVWRRVSASHIVSDALTAILLGPFGAVGLLARAAAAVPLPVVDDGDAVSAHTPEPEGRFSDSLVESIRQGRRISSIGRPVAPLTAVLEHGDRVEQNAAVRSISRHYDPRMLPALMQALNSASPATRVQAAAVYGKLRSTFGAQARALLAIGVRPDDAEVTEQRISACRRVAASGFVDPVTAKALLRLAEVLEFRARLGRMRRSHRAFDVSAATAIAGLGLGADGSPTAPPRLKRHACGGIL